MKIWWCQEHEASAGPTSREGGPIVCLAWVARQTCRLVPMRLIPDNGETVWWCLVHRSIGTETRCDGWQLVSAFHEPQSPCRIVAAHLIHAGETVT